MEKNGFYVTLPSNSSHTVYPSNKIWRYRTKLAKTIVLSEPHEVGLIEIQYPKVWNSFPATDSGVLVYDAKTQTTSTVLVEAGCYESVPAIVSEFNTQIRAHHRLAPHFQVMIYNAVKNRVYFTGVMNGLTVTFKGRLAEILGFKPEVPFTINDDKRHGSSTAPYPSDIHAGCYNIFVYSDIADYQLVGDSYVPLLRCINVADDQRRIPTLTYDKPHYTSLSTNVIDDIEIALKDDQNQYIPFLYGKVVVKLHFRPIRQGI